MNRTVLPACPRPGPAQRKARLRRALAPAAAVIAAAGAMAACASPAAPAATGSQRAPLTVTTTNGRLHGLDTATAREFLGVRFAQPPTGKRRWTLPQPVPRSAGVTQATKPGARCAQTGAQQLASTSEDCLFLNVTTPRDLAPGQKLPVMVWWHGGGYTSGTGSEYDAQRLATQGHVIVVTANKRLGIFGYLGLPGLAGSGDFGFADQIAATRWAKDNAAAFGGDASNITVFGESDGAMAACALLTSPAAQGLVNKVAMESGGSCLLNWPKDGLVPGAPAQTPYSTLTADESVSRAEAKTFHCAGGSTLSCLRSIPVTKLLKVSGDFSDLLSYGTPLLPRNPATALLAGHTLRVPVLSGGNLGEERSFVAGAEEAKPGTFTKATYPKLLKAAFGKNAAQVEQHYPLGKYASPGLAFATLITDDSWACPTLTGNAALSRTTDVYGYEFADPDSPNVNGVHAPGIPQGSAHATDLPYLFDLGGKNLLPNATQRTLSRTMIAYWSSFARTGHPSAAGQPTWPRLTSASGPTLQLRPGRPGLVSIAAEHQCAFWNRLR